MDLQRDAARLASIATVFVWVGWVAIIYAFIAGLFWWIDLAGRPAFNFIEAFAISAAAIGVPLFLALIVAALGHALRLLAALRRPLRRLASHTGTVTIMRRLGILATLLLVVAGCTGGTDDKTADGEGGELGATRWVLQSMLTDGALTIVPDGLYADAQFQSLRVKGFSGCNRYDAVYRTGGRTLIVSNVVSTRMACPEPAFTFESAYLDLLQQSSYYNVRSDTLTIRGADASVLLVFLAAPSNPLLGSWVVDSYQSAPNTLSAPLPDSHMTAVFGLSNVAGFAGCNSYTGPYTTERRPSPRSVRSRRPARPAPTTSWPRRRRTCRARRGRAGRSRGRHAPAPGPHAARQSSSSPGR